MKVKQDNICKKCKKVFCCIVCRKNHEIKQNYTSGCYFCAGGLEVVPYGTDNNEDQCVIHLATHLPLFCIKCNKILSTPLELQVLKSVKCSKPKPKMSKTSNQVQKTIKEAQTSDLATTTTPTMTMTNLKWVQKSCFSSAENMSFIRNASSFINNHSSKITSTMVRSTSTPTQELMCMFQTNNFINSSSSTQMSSICCPLSMDTFTSPNVQEILNAPKVDQKFKFPFQKHMVRPRSTHGTTPLRQVMSKNFHHRAFMQRDIFMLNLSPAYPSPGSPFSQPLDLRTSVVIRRCSKPGIDDDLKGSSTIQDFKFPLTGSDDLARTPQKPIPNFNESDSDESEKFYTPIRESAFLDSTIGSANVRVSVSYTEIDEQSQSYLIVDNENGVKENKNYLWTIIGSVCRMLQFGHHQGDNIEGGRVNSVKRRRTYGDQQPPSKRSRIQGRPPISRMRQS